MFSAALLIMCLLSLSVIFGKFLLSRITRMKLYIEFSVCILLLRIVASV